MSKYNLMEIFEEMSTTEKERFDRLSKDDQDKLKKIMDMMAKEKSMKEDKYDDIVDADDDIPADEKKAAAAAYRKVDRGASYEKATSHLKEDNIEEMTGEIYSRIDGLTNQNLKAQFLDKFSEIYEDMLEAGDLFDVSDVIDYLCTEMQAYAVDTKMDVGGMMEENDSIDEGISTSDIAKALKDDAKATDSEIKQYMASVKKAGDKFDDVDDYVEDFKNYVADKGLQEHFGRFFKDYQ